MSKISFRSVLALTASSVALMSAAGAYAADNGAGAEGAEVSSIVVTAERGKAAETAPSKASIEETQPESIITHKFIEQATPETGGWVDVASIAPSISGIGANGGGVGETAKITLRGFQDGQFNITYDGISFADTNGPTHHEASYWPASTIGTVVIDRGPGAAGDLGPANFGGAVHLFSPQVTDTFNFSQKLTYGSFTTLQSVTQVNTGALPQLGGGKLFLSFEERASKGELSWSGGASQNQLAKFVLPLKADWQLVLFGSHNYTRFYQNDGTGAGETEQQLAHYGKNFALTNIPGEEHYYKYNQQAKQTDFEYADIKGTILPSFTFEDQLYTYFYKNSTLSATDNTGLIGDNSSSKVQAPAANRLPGQTSTDLQGYDKLNMYRVWGDIVRLNKDFSFGTLKVGGLYEWSTTDRHNLLLDITNGYTPDLKFVPNTLAHYLVPGPTNAKLQENSDWQDYQIFADFYWRPIDNLTITPGFKFVHEHLEVRAADENTAGGSKNQSLFDSTNSSSPVYFVTANYKITPYWSVYGQFATSFLFPDITTLYFASAGSGLASIQPEKTQTYQAGTVFSRGHFTADADVYRVDATNLIQLCGTGVNQSDCNVGKAQYNGFEGEAAYAFDFGLTLFANGGSNTAATVGGTQLTKSPRWTDAFGGVLNHGPWQGSVSYKQSGSFLPFAGAAHTLPGYDTIDASVAYDFGNYKIKLQGANLADKRAITSLTGPATTPTSYVEFQAGREVEVTLQAKF